jgi:hypothetical protein
MRGPNEIVREGTITIQFGLVSQIIIVEGKEEVAEIIEANTGRRETKRV